jgi:hypothetical protein
MGQPLQPHSDCGEQRAGPGRAQHWQHRSASLQATGAFLPFDDKTMQAIGSKGPVLRDEQDLDRRPRADADLGAVIGAGVQACLQQETIEQDVVSSAVNDRAAAVARASRVNSSTRLQNRICRPSAVTSTWKSRTHT